MMVGSGVLIGPRLLLTASHAVPWDTSNWSVRFAPAYRNGNDPRFGHAYVDEWRGVRNVNDVTGLDYVICKLNWRIGDRTGWLGSWWSGSKSFYYGGSG
jgi:V8-like Glu-specific endopeptidase